MDAKLEIGERLRALREEREVTQTKMAQSVGCSARMLSNYELNKRQPDLRTLKAISEYLNVSADYLLGSVNAPSAVRALGSMGGEAALLDIFRRLPPPLRKDVLRYARLNLLDIGERLT